MPSVAPLVSDIREQPRLGYPEGLQLEVGTSASVSALDRHLFPAESAARVYVLCVYIYAHFVVCTYSVPHEQAKD